ncbi:MAG: MFS transporter [Stellaceae bacterium]
MTPGPARWQPWVITGLLFFFMFINFADKAVIGLAALPMMRDLQLSPVQWGRVGSSFFWLFSLSAILTGFVVNRLPAKWVIAVMALIWALTQFPMLGLVSFPMLIACRVVLGAGEGPAYPVALHAVYKWFPNNLRTLPTAIIAIGAGVGVVVAAPVLVDVITAYGWHAAFGLLGVVGLVWTVAWAIFGREGEIAEPVVAAAGGGGDRVPYLRLLTCPTMLGIFIAGFVAYWGLAMLVAWTPPFLQAGLGYGVDATKWLVAASWAASALLTPLVGALSQRAKLKGASSRAARAIPAALLLTAAGTLGVAALLLSTGGVQIALLIATHSIGAPIYTLLPAMVGEITPLSQRGAMLCISNAVATLAGLIAPEVAGHIIAGAATPAQGYVASFLLAGAIIASGGLISLLLLRPEADIARFAARSAAASHALAAQ